MISPNFFDDKIEKLTAEARDVVDPHGALQALVMVGIFQQLCRKNDFLQTSLEMQKMALENSVTHTSISRELMTPLLKSKPKARGK